MDKQYKSIDFGLFGGIDEFLRISSNHTGGLTGRASQIKSVVPWLAKAVSMTSNAVASLPFEIVNDGGEVIDTSTDWGNELNFMDNPIRLITLIAGSLCGGSAYLIPDRTSSRIIDLQYVSPHTINPVIDKDGLQYFERSFTGGGQVRLLPKDIIYFWLPDSDVEIGPPLTSPMSTALPAAELLASMTSTMKIYGDRGFVPAYLGNAKGMPNPTDRQATENYLTAFLRGAFKSVVKLINSEVLTLQRVGAGMEELKGAYTEIQQQAIEDIGTAFGIPAALFMSDKAFASEVTPLIRQWYETSVFVSIYHTIEETFNKQVLSPNRMQFKPESLDVFQEDENARSSSVSAYTSTISDNPDVAKFVMEFMGVDLDEEQEAALDAIIADKEAKRQEARDRQQKNDAIPADNTVFDLTQGKSIPSDAENNIAAELIKWREFARKPRKREFETKHIPPALALRINAGLRAAKTEEEIQAVFDTAQAEIPVIMLANAINGMDR